MAGSFEPIPAYTGFLAAADLRTSQYFLVKVTSATQVNLCTVAGEQVFGVLDNAPNTGQVARVVFGGFCKVKAGATHALMAPIKAGTDGRTAAVVLGTGNPLTASNACGFVLKACVAGDVVDAWIGPVGVVPTTVG